MTEAVKDAQTYLDNIDIFSEHSQTQQSDEEALISRYSTIGDLFGETPNDNEKDSSASEEDNLHSAFLDLDATEPSSTTRFVATKQILNDDPALTSSIREVTINQKFLSG